MSQNFEYYHVHIYCKNEQIPLCQQIREKMLLDLEKNIEGAGPVRNRPVGPHPLPMFEAWFLADQLANVMEWVLKNRNDLPVLFHPLSGDEIKDHTDFAIWIGEKQDLDLSVLN